MAKKKSEEHFHLKYDPREDQNKMLEFSIESIEKDNKYVLLNSPTGSGKSYYAIMLANWYKKKFGADKKITILTGSKILQEQYVQDFPFIKNLKGQSNYYCSDHRTDCGTAKELNEILKHKCSDCPYDKAKVDWIAGDMSLTNFHMFDTFSIYVPKTIEARKTNLLIIDEAHDFESIFTDYISVKISSRILRNCGFNSYDLENYDKILKRINSTERFILFLTEKFLIDVDRLIEYYGDQISDENDFTKRKIYMEYLVKLKDQKNKFEKFLTYYENDKDNWIMDVSVNPKNKFLSGIEITLQPIWSGDYLKEIVWDLYDHIIFMSGTILSKEMFSFLNGLEIDKTSYIELDSSFPIENRLIYYVDGIGKMTYEHKKRTFEKQVVVLDRILNKYKNKKGIIHTVNYEIADWLKEKMENDRFLFHDLENREEKYQEFINSEEPKIMVSPSMGTGISLDDDLARFSISLKVPYPNISSNKVKKRQESKPEWYKWITACYLIQSFGRVVRSETDYGYNFVLDGSFSNVIRDGYLPKYILDSIKILK